MSFTPEELADEIKEHVPEFNVEYKIDHRQKIGESCGSSDLDISRADSG